MSIKSKLSILSVALLSSLVITGCANNVSSSVESIQPSSTDYPTSMVSSSDMLSSSIDVSPSSNVMSSSSAAPSSQTKSSSEPISSSIETKKCVVAFVVDGQTIDTQLINPGENVIVPPTPTKQASGDIVKYRFKGWNKDVTAPISEDTVFTGSFAAYVASQMIDDFESYEDTPSMMDEGWEALGYDNIAGWTTNTKAAVSLGVNSKEGEKALRFDAWENGVGYKFAKNIEKGSISYSANALQFKLMAPSINTLKVLLHLEVTVEGQLQTPYFTYTIDKVPSGEYVDYTIPLNDENWAMWSEAGKSIHTVADWMGVHEDDILPYLKKIEFYVQGSDGVGNLPYVAFLDSAKFVTIDELNYQANEQFNLYKTYTASLTDGHIVRIDINDNGKAVAKIIDSVTPIEVECTASISNKSFQLTSTPDKTTFCYNGVLTNGGQLVKFTSATGSFASQLDGVDLLAVQVVDNFEQYAIDGQAYCQKYPLNERSGARGAYYSEYYNENNSTSSPWGGSKWSLMGGEGDQLKLKKDPTNAHSGNNYLCLKNSSSNGMRYMQWGLFDGSAEKNSFRGNKLSFWAKTNGVVKKFYASMYSQSAPTNATRDNYVKKVTFTETAAINEWKHYEVELNPNVVYYGYMMYLEANWSTDSYLYIDDVEVYGADPYAFYKEPEPEKPLTLATGSNFFAKISDLVKAEIAISGENTAKLSIPGFAISVNGTYSIYDKDVTFIFDGVTYVVSYDEATGKLTYKSISGSGDIATALNNLSFNKINKEDAESYASSGVMYYQSQTNEDARSGARGAYYCDYYSGSGTSPVGGPGWLLMGGSGDQLQLDNTNSYTGNQSLKLKRSSAGAMRYMQWDLYKGTAKAMTDIDKFSVYLANPNASSVLAKICVYTAQQVTPSNQTTDRVMLEQTLPANSDWTKYTINLDASKTYYGFAIILEHDSTTAWVNMDDAMFYNSDNNPELNFYSKNDLVLNGNLTIGSASLKFKDNGATSFTCASLSVSDVNCSYVMSMDNGTQIMEITINDTIVTGTYAVSGSGVVSYTVTSATGSLASYINVGAVFANN